MNLKFTSAEWDRLSYAQQGLLRKLLERDAKFVDGVPVRGPKQRTLDVLVRVGLARVVGACGRTGTRYARIEPAGRELLADYERRQKEAREIMGALREGALEREEAET